MISPDLLDIICCPETHQRLQLAPQVLLMQLNEQVAAGQLKNRAGQVVREPLDAALVRNDQKFAYPVRKDIPIMLIDEAIPLAS